MRRTVVVILAGSFAVANAAPTLVPDDLPGPDPEAIKQPAAVELPMVPGFELPATEPGLHTARGLRVSGKPLLGTEVRVTGYVTAVHDCITELARTNRKTSRAKLVEAIDRNPALCDHPRFYLGDAPNTPRERSLWVVDLPAPRLPRRGQPAPPVPPELSVGDRVVATGTWVVHSPGGMHNTDGLLVYRAVEPAHPTPPDMPAMLAPSPAEPAVTITTKVPLRAPIAEAARNGSVEKLNQCSREMAARRYDAALAACQAALQIWDGNHRAWYAQASVHMAKNEWPAATTAIERAVTLRPDQAMYQLYHGVALYEAAWARARQSAKADDAINPSSLSLDDARDALLRATRLDPSLWRAHFYLGRVYRDHDDARPAAVQFAQTITTHPSYRFGYIALIELYRRWDYFDQALAVALAGTTRVPAAEAPELWFEAGMAYDAKREDAKAIDAFTRAITGKPDDVRARFQRGQIHARRGDAAGARPDLEAVIASGDPRIAPLRPIATQLLSRLPAR